MRLKYRVAAGLAIGLAMLGTVRADDAGTQQEAPAHRRFAVQLGSFSDDSNAHAWASKLKAAGVPAYTERRSQADGSTRTLLRAGPFDSRAEASAAVAKVREAGLAPSTPSGSVTQPGPVGQAVARTSKGDSTKRDVTLEQQIAEIVAPIAGRLGFSRLGENDADDWDQFPRVEFVTQPHCDAQACKGIEIYYEREPCGPDYRNVGFHAAGEDGRWNEDIVRSRGACFDIITRALTDRRYSEEIAEKLPTLTSDTSQTDRSVSDNNRAPREPIPGQGNNAKDRTWYIVDTQHGGCVEEEVGLRLISDIEGIDTPEKYAAGLTARGRAQTVVPGKSRDIVLVRDNQTLTFMAFARGKLLCDLALKTAQAATE